MVVEWRTLFVALIVSTSFAGDVSLAGDGKADRANSPLEQNIRAQIQKRAESQGQLVGDVASRFISVIPKAAIYAAYPGPWNIPRRTILNKSVESASQRYIGAPVSEAWSRKAKRDMTEAVNKLRK